MYTYPPAMANTWELRAYLNDPPRITNARFQTYCARFIAFSPNQQWGLYFLGDDNKAQDMAPRNRSAIQRGRYVILGSQRQQIGLTLRTDQRQFRDSVFGRDGQCVITGDCGPAGEPILELVATYIYPVALRNEWDDYRIVVFNDDSRDLRGRVLSTSTRQGHANYRVSDDCLCWHFQQCILTHMRGAGEPSWDLYGDHYDKVNAIMQHEDAAELMETSLPPTLKSAEL
ncbi:hypothetical protein BDV06DRAFT_211177 [Aspergillus oleicola]